MAAIVDFYYGLGSRYSYLAATQIDVLEREHGARVAWHPLTSGALMDMRRQNPFRGEPVSGQYDWAYRRRDAEDWANLYGVPFIEPVGRIEFDRDLPALACLAAKRLGEEVAYSREMFRMMFAEERTRLTRDDAVEAAGKLGLDRDAFADVLDGEGVRRDHDRELAMAKARGVFGVPTFFVEGRMFWGNDRLPLVRAVLDGRI
jgi:2-hydroxychromene-2-carboxylate isomerase